MVWMLQTFPVRLLGVHDPLLPSDRGLRRRSLPRAVRASRRRVAIEMPAEPAQALRFGKARIARSTAVREDYVELIADLLAAAGEARATDVAKRLGVTYPTAVKNICRLKREGLVQPAALTGGCS